MTESGAAPRPAERPSRGRAFAAGLCLVLAALLTVPAAFAYWGQRTINDGQRYVDTVGPLVDSPEVQAAVATKVTDAIQRQVDVEAILNRVFADVITDRPRLEALVGPLAGAINGLIDSQVRAFIASDAFADFWVAANTRAQSALVRVLEGEESGALSVQGEQVVLDVSEVIDQVKQRLIARGLTIVERVPIPDVDRQIVLLDAPQLEQARTIYAFGNPVARWLIVLVAALYLAAFILSRNRPRTTIIIGAVLAANALFVGLMLSIGQQLFVNQLSGTVFGPASRVFYEQLLSYLERGQQVLLWLGLDPDRRRVVRGSQRARNGGTIDRQRWPGVGGLPARRRLSRRRGPMGRSERRLAALCRRRAGSRGPALGQQHLRVEVVLVVDARGRSPHGHPGFRGRRAGFAANRPGTRPRLEVSASHTRGVTRHDQG